MTVEQRSDKKKNIDTPPGYEWVNVSIGRAATNMSGPISAPAKTDWQQIPVEHVVVQGYHAADDQHRRACSKQKVQRITDWVS